MTVLVDSDILIEVLRGRDEGILARWMELGESGDFILCSPVSVAELWHGARPREHQALENLFRALICLPIDAETGRQAELGDALIAAAVLQQNAALWTRNRKHYPMRRVEFY